MATLKEKLYSFKVWKVLMFDYPEMNLGPVDYNAYWKDKRGKDLGALSDWQTTRARFVVDTLPKESVSILDIGCGDGNILNYIKNHAQVSSMFGADVSDFALAKAKEFGVTPIKIDITKPDIAKDLPEADFAIMFEILEHIQHSEEFLLQVYGKMKRGVYFSFPNTGFFPHRFRLLFGKFPMQWRLFPGEHLRYWTKTDLHWWLKSLGMKNYQMHYYKGVPILNKLWPSMFAAGFIVLIPKGK